MRKICLKQLLATALSVSILVGCTQIMPNSINSETSNYTPSISATTSTPLDKDDLWDSIELSSKRYSINSVESIPEMKELTIRIAIATNVAKGFNTALEIDENEIPSTSFSNLILDYLFYMEVEHGENNLFPNGLDKGNGNGVGAYLVPAKDFTLMAKDYLADPAIQANIENITNWYSMPEKPKFVELLLPTLHKNYYSSYYRIGWVDDGDLRYVLATDFHGSALDHHEKNDVMKLIFEKDETGTYRLLDGAYSQENTYLTTEQNSVSSTASNYNNTVELQKKEPPPNMVEWEDATMAKNIIGGISNRFIALAYNPNWSYFYRWRTDDNYENDLEETITLYALNPQTQKITKQLVLESKLLNYRFKNDKLFLYFENDISILDENLEVVQKIDLPASIKELIERGSSEIYNSTDPDYFEFLGYDISPDLSTFVYSSEKGTFLYDINSGKTTKIYEPIITGSETSVMGIYLKIFWSPYFTLDGTRIYGFFPSYETYVPFAYYDISTSKLTEWDTFSPNTVYDTELSYEENLINFFAVPSNAGLLDLFKYPFDILLADDYFITDFRTSDEENNLYIGTFTNPTIENLVEIHFEEPMYIVSILPNQQLLMTFQNSYSMNILYKDQYFILDISSYLN